MDSVLRTQREQEYKQHYMHIQYISSTVYIYTMYTACICMVPAKRMEKQQGKH